MTPAPNKTESPLDADMPRRTDAQAAAERNRNRSDNRNDNNGFRVAAEPANTRTREPRTVTVQAPRRLVLKRGPLIRARPFW